MLSPCPFSEMLVGHSSSVKALGPVSLTTTVPAYLGQSLLLHHTNSVFATKPIMPRGPGAFTQAPMYGSLRSSCSLQVLQGLIQGAGSAYQPFFDTTMQQLIWKCLYHPNRFIREIGYETCGDLCVVFAGRSLQAWGKDLAVKLQDGLSENWSQV